jgi:hypothetical protein
MILPLRRTASYRLIPQVPVGAQEPAVDVLSAPQTPNSETALFTPVLPHLGQVGMTCWVNERTSFSNFSPHSVHRYSYTGILSIPLYTVLGYSILQARKFVKLTALWYNI